MKKQIIHIIEMLRNINTNICALADYVLDSTCKDRTIANMTDTIKQQDKIINDLINNIYGRDTSLQAVLVVPYRGKPKLFKDGKRLDTKSMTSFDIDWACDRAVDITVRNE